jgi:putative FmdB family regulatory protein
MARTAIAAEEIVMPIYEYRCARCGHEFEVEQRITEPPIRRCAKCKRNGATRQISAASFVLKGGGWYADGYASRRASRQTESKESRPKESTAGGAASDG